MTLQQTTDQRFYAWRETLKRRSSLCFRLRVALVLLFTAAAAAPLHDALRVGTAAASVAAFLAVAIAHRRIELGIARTDALLRVRREQRARRELDWDALPPALEVETQPLHPFAGDLDLFGPNGLHRFLDISVSREGSRLLASWLSSTDTALPDILSRRDSVRALVPAAHFRERLLLAFSLASKERLDGASFLQWLSHTQAPSAMRWVLPASALLAALNITLFLAWGSALLPPLFLIGVFLYAVLYLRYSAIRESFIDAAVRLDDELGKLHTVFRFLERGPLGGSKALAQLLLPFRDMGLRPSRHIRRVRVDVIAAGLSMNPVMMVLLNLAFPWDFLFAARLERKRKTLAQLVPAWLDGMHRLEALQSLANYAWLFPETRFPELHAADGTTPVFHAEDLGHPLLPLKSRVRNDVSLAAERDILLITGSNMSGKSTLLRTVGISVVLAMAGGPVDARHMSLAHSRLFTCINISDSLRDGVSYFYAEVRRLRRLLDLLDDSDDRPPLFLIDEMFRGTNTRERHVGGEAFIRELARRRATGAISTHDIELTSVADAVDGVRNMHFREHIVDNRMEFDYTLREGPCPTTNALVIMRLEGLPVGRVSDAASAGTGG